MKSTVLALASASGALAVTHQVSVGKLTDGNLALKFEPETVIAAVGDEVEYTFYPNHDVAQGPFGSPCSNGNGTTSGPFFYSGRLTFENPSERSTEATQKFIYTVTDTTPKWYYCTTGTHCADGMVGVINPPSSGPNTLEAYRTNAASAQKQTPEDVVVLGELVDAEGNVESPPNSAPTPSAAAPPAETPGAGSPSGTAPPAESPTGAASSISISGSSSVLALLAGVAAWLL